MPILVLPNAAYIQSFLEGERELRQAERRSFMGTLDPLVSTNATILKSFADTSAGINLPPGRTQSTAYWLIDDCSRFVGSVSIRGDLSNEELRVLVGHIGYTIRPSARRQGYGKLILRLALPKAQAMGIDPALLTCDKTNVASRRIIESCGGVYESEAPQKAGLPPKLRFWVPTAPVPREMPLIRGAVK